jgi:hypothetical protein
MGLGVGAALMYLFDPQDGDRRRAMLRDKATKLNRQTREAFEGTVTDISGRAKGIAHDMRSNMMPESGDRDKKGWSSGPAV